MQNEVEPLNSIIFFLYMRGPEATIRYIFSCSQNCKVTTEELDQQLLRQFRIFSKLLLKRLTYMVPTLLQVNIFFVTYHFLVIWIVRLFNQWEFSLAQSLLELDELSELVTRGQKYFCSSDASCFTSPSV